VDIALLFKSMILLTESAEPHARPMNFGIPQLECANVNLLSIWSVVFAVNVMPQLRFTIKNCNAVIVLMDIKK